MSTARTSFDVAQTSQNARTETTIVVEETAMLQVREYRSNKPLVRAFGRLLSDLSRRPFSAADQLSSILRGVWPQLENAIGSINFLRVGGLFSVYNFAPLFFTSASTEDDPPPSGGAGANPVTFRPAAEFHAPVSLCRGFEIIDGLIPIPARRVIVAVRATRVIEHLILVAPLADGDGHRGTTGQARRRVGCIGGGDCAIAAGTGANVLTDAAHPYDPIAVGIMAMKATVLHVRGVVRAVLLHTDVVPCLPA